MLYAGDLNAIQDGAAAQADFTQTIDLGTLRIGETGLQLLRYGTNEARLTGTFRTDGILRGLGGTLAGAYTTTQRNAIPLGSRPYGVQILNITTNQYEFNSGTDATPAWRPTGVDPTGVLVFTGDQSSIHFTNQQPNNSIITSRRTGDTFDRSLYRENGRIEWGDGLGITDAALARDTVGRIRIENDLLLAGTHLYFGSTSNSNILGDSAQIAARVGTSFKVQSQDGGITYATIDSTGIKSSGMDVERTPRGPNRHIEMGLINTAFVGFSTAVSGSATFVDPFSAPPYVVFSIAGNPNYSSPPFGMGLLSVSTTGFSLFSYSDGYPGFTRPFYYVAEGPD